MTGKLGILFLTVDLAILTGCTPRTEAPKDKISHGPETTKTMTPREQALVDLDPSSMTIDEILELGKASPSYAAQKLRLRIGEKVRWNESDENWDLSKLTTAEAMVWRLDKFDSEIGNGGLSQFFLNKGRWTPQILKDLQTIGCEPVLVWIREALKAIPESSLSGNPSQLEEALESAPDLEASTDLWHKLDAIWYRTLEGEISTAVARYFIKNHPEFPKSSSLGIETQT